MPVDRGVIDAQLREIGEGERWWEQREFRDLPYILHPEERIRGIVVARILGRRRPRLPFGDQWLVVATDQRLVCLRQERYGRKQMDFHPGQIDGVHHGARLRHYQITLETPTRRYRLRLQREDAFRFLRALEALVPQPPVGGAGAGLLGALPGVTRLLGAAAAEPPATRAELSTLQETVERLEGDVERLQQQVEFLERLLQQRAEEAHSLSGTTADE